MTDPRLRGLYAVTSAALCRAPAQLLAAADAALTGGARLLQYRDKESGADTRRHTAIALLERCRAHGALLIVNDDVALARAIGADGVHLGAHDAPLREARRELPDAVIGVSCGNQLARAAAAARDGASYVAFGRFFPSRTKPEAPPASLAVLREARARVSLPICAIGGVTLANAGALVAAGADMVAAVEGVFGVPDVQAAARAFVRLFVR